MSSVSTANTANFDLEVLRSGIPVLVDFYASWCAPCRALTPILNQVAENYEGRVKFVKVNIDEEPDLADEFQVSGVPALYFFKNGGVVDRIVGLPAPQELLSRLDALSSTKGGCSTRPGSRSCGCGAR